jgi:hypothetical protein
MRFDGDGRAIDELTLLLTPHEAQQAVAVLNQLLAVVPSEQKVTENEFDDAPSLDVGGTRIVRVVVYDDPEVEQRHDAEFARQ